MKHQEQIEAYWSDPARERELVGAIARLVNVKSVKGDPEPGKPFGPGPAAALDEALALCRELGISTSDYAHNGGLADLNDKETRLHILGHLDVVGEGSGWDTDPYTCVEKDGMLYGRGVSDDKGPVVCALLAMKAVRDLGLPLSANVRCILGTDEESGSADIASITPGSPTPPWPSPPTPTSLSSTLRRATIIRTSAPSGRAPTPSPGWPPSPAGSAPTWYLPRPRPWYWAFTPTM